ncbi:hypothetical protein, partial [Lactobacillus delbrueckii]|uniref:hypothetical protein n=2 Tax=Lactobacillus delbrueckii TaxID=1584 RepID=UPI0021A2CFFA
TNCRDNCTNLQYQLHPTEIWIQLLQLAPRVKEHIGHQNQADSAQAIFVIFDAKPDQKKAASHEEKSGCQSRYRSAGTSAA